MVPGAFSFAGSEETGSGSPVAARSGASSSSDSARSSVLAGSESTIRVAVSSWNSPDLASMRRGAGTIGYRSGAGFGPVTVLLPAHPTARSKANISSNTTRAMRL